VWQCGPDRQELATAEAVLTRGGAPKPTEDLHRLQDEVVTAVRPYTAKTGSPAAFFSEVRGRDIQKFLIAPSTW
jgi:hypothetical protein